MSVLESTFEKMSIYPGKDTEISEVVNDEQIEVEGAVGIVYERSSSEEVHFPVTVSEPSADHSFEGNSARVRKKALVVLKQVDEMIEKIRQEALRIEDEKESILSSLDSLKNSSELFFLPEGEYRELANLVDSQVSRLLSIDIRVNTVRSRLQEEALHRVNGCIDQLVLKLHEDPVLTRAACIDFLKACDNGAGTMDFGFVAAISECSSDDRKRVRRRLVGLLSYMESCHRSVSLEVLE